MGRKKRKPCAFCPQGITTSTQFYPIKSLGDGSYRLGMNKLLLTNPSKPLDVSQVYVCHRHFKMNLRMQKKHSSTPTQSSFKIIEEKNPSNTLSPSLSPPKAKRMKVIDCVYGLLLLNEKKECFEKNEIDNNVKSKNGNDINNYHKPSNQLNIQKLINQNDIISQPNNITEKKMNQPNYELLFNNSSMNYQNNFVFTLYDPLLSQNFNYVNSNKIKIPKIIHIPKPVRAYDSLNE